MSRRLMITFLATICLWWTAGLGQVCAQERGGYAHLMSQAGQSMLESKPDAARQLYAQAVEADAGDAAHEMAALLLVMTFEKAGVLQEEECRAWAKERFADARGREIVERALQNYNRKLFGRAAAQDQADEDQIEETGVGVAAALPLVEEIQRKTQAAAYDQLMLKGEELQRIGNLHEARSIFTRALLTEPATQILSRAATAIVLSFKEGGALNATACKSWAEANVPTAEGRQRIELAVGECYYRSQEHDRAIAQLESIASQKGMIAESASMVIALCLVAKGEQDAALARLERVAAESSVDEVAAKALFLIGWTHLQAQQYAPAKSALDRLAAKYPNSQLATKAQELSERLKAYEKK